MTRDAPDPMMPFMDAPSEETMDGEYYSNCALCRMATDYNRLLSMSEGRSRAVGQKLSRVRRILEGGGDLKLAREWLDHVEKCVVAYDVVV